MQKKINEKETDMVLIPAGEFTFGISDDEIRRLYGNQSAISTYRDEMHELGKATISLPDFYIDRFPVTNGRYRLFMQENSVRRPPYIDTSIWGGADQPVVGITWAEAESFAKWAGKRLPTEKEWEKAARGADGRLFPWGNDLKKIYSNCWESGLECTSNVGSFPESESPYGVQDMAGNIWEMTSDKYDDEMNAMRGGSYLTYQIFCRVTARWAPSKSEMERRPHWLGFRCVKNG